MSNKKYLESESLKDAMWKNFYKEEDKWESMPEADFLDVHGGCPRHWFQLGFSAGLDAVVKADAVPQEMSAREYERAIDRAFYSDDDAYGEWADAIDEGNKDKAVAIIEKWARKHPEERSED